MAPIAPAPDIPDTAAAAFPVTALPAEDVAPLAALASELVAAPNPPEELAPVLLPPVLDAPLLDMPLLEEPLLEVLLLPPVNEFSTEEGAPVTEDRIDPGALATDETIPPRDEVSEAGAFVKAERADSAEERMLWVETWRARRERTGAMTWTRILR